MKVVLVKPPEHSPLNFGTFSLAVVGAAIRDSADITILDFTNTSIDQAVTKTIEHTPDIVGVTTMGRTSVEPTCAYVEMLRKYYPGIIVVGGHGATMMPHPVLHAGATAVVLGEGETTLKEIVNTGIKDTIKGLALLRDGHVVKTPVRPLIEPLDNIPEPARDLAGPPPQGIGLVETSRGCPYKCLFCEASRFYHGIWRPHSPNRVVKDIQNVVSSGATIVHIVDDNFTVDPKRVLHICEALENKGLPLFFYFSARSDDLLHPGLIPALARAHFLRAGIGIETLEPELAHFIGKPISFDIHKKACTALRKAGIFTVASFITGLPGETDDMRKRCVELAVKVGCDAAQFVPFQPLPGTPLEKGTGEPEAWAKKAAAQYTNEFRRHPSVVSRLLESGHEYTVRGMLARNTLAKWVTEGVFGSKDEKIREELLGIDPGLFTKGSH
ncbi:MAG: radical SAM protein [Candidatus Methanofastidiosia archaeon]|jgi:anaerobic magnesium-protoporphyrin IX monomethyl ester cyclase